MDACKCGHCAGSSEQVKTRTGSQMLQAVAPFEYAEQTRHFIDHRLEHLARYIPPAEALGQRNHADGERCPGNNVISEPGRTLTRNVNQRDLGRAATNIEQNDTVSIPFDKRTAAGNRQPRLGAAVDDLERQSRFRLDARQKLRAVHRRTAGLRRDQTGAAHGA